VLRIFGDYAASLACGEEIIRLTEADDSIQEFFADGLRIKGLALYRLGRVREAVDHLERSLYTYTRLNALSQIPVLAMETGMAYRAVGDFAAARLGYEKALKVWQEEGNLFSQTGLLNNMGGLYQALGEYEHAAQAFEEGLLCSRRSRNIRYEGLITLSLGDLYAEMEDFDMARQAYARAEEIIRGMTDRFLSNSLAFSNAALALAQKDLPRAESILLGVKDSVMAGRSKLEESQFDLLRGRLRLLEGNPQEASKHLQNAIQLLSEDGRETEKNIAGIWLAAAHRRNENRAEAAQILAETASNAGKNLHGVLVAVHQAGEWLGSFQGDSTIGRNARDMTAQAERLAEKLPGLRRQLRRQAQAISGPVPHLLVKAFGDASVSVDGRLLTNSDWQTQSVRELFFFLLSAPKPLAKEKIGETLWQDQYDGAKLKLRFKNELYRLRRAIGREDVVLYRDDRYTFNRSLDHEYDVEAFETFLSKAKASEDPKAQAEYLQKAADLFQGPYLNNLDADWAILERERLGQAYLNALLSLSELYLKAAQLESCIETCQRAEAFDPGCEPAYRIHMQALARLGDRAGFQRIYQTCRDALQNLFNLMPSKETEDLYQHSAK
jgi:two-component SAPR family response regulator/Flp pilus assembly protein TadD